MVGGLRIGDILDRCLLGRREVVVCRLLLALVGLATGEYLRMINVALGLSVSVVSRDNMHESKREGVSNNV
jgi:hypothetical protein